jgi:hypothetical protein
MIARFTMWVVFMLFPLFTAASGTAHRIVCAGEQFEVSGSFPISCVQVDTASVATDPNIAGSRYPGELSRPPRFKPNHYRSIAHTDWPGWRVLTVLMPSTPLGEVDIFLHRSASAAIHGE